MASKAKMVNIYNIPPMEELIRAYVATNDGNLDEHKALGYDSTDKMRRVAIQMRDLSRDRCHACGKPSDPRMRKADSLKWGELPICPCLAKYRKGYHEYYPWREKTEEITQGVTLWEQAKARGDDPSRIKGAIDPTTKLYSNQCLNPECGKVFTVFAGGIANVIRAPANVDRTYTEAKRCMKCRHGEEVARKGGVAGRPMQPHRRQDRRQQSLPLTTPIRTDSVPRESPPHQSSTQATPGSGKDGPYVTIKRAGSEVK